MDLLTAFRSATRQFDSRVEAIGASQWHSRTPNTEWDVSDLLSHLISEQLWVPELLAGRTIAEVGDKFDGDVLGEDPKHTWRTASAAASAALCEPGALERTVHLSYGDVPTPEYGWQLTQDLLVHAWDLARAIGAPDHMPNDLVTEVLERARPMIHEFQGSSLFAAPIAVPGCTDDLTELLALLGRRR